MVLGRAKRADLKAVWDRNQSCEWWLLQHFQDPLPRNMEEWVELHFTFAQYPTDEENVLVGGSTFEDDRDLFWREFEAKLNIKLNTLTIEKLKSEIRQVEERLAARLQ